MAEAIFHHKIAEKGLADYVEADSAGTASYHVGKTADPRTISTVERMGIRIVHAARQVNRPDLAYYDYILAMDAENKKGLNALVRADQKLGGTIYLMRDFEPPVHPKNTAHEKQYSTKVSSVSQHTPPTSQGLAVPDPYYGGEEGFQEVYAILDRTIEHFIQFLQEKHKF